MRSILFIASLVSASVCVTNAKTTPVSAHGTVNVLLANKNGLVAVTDSRLSSNGQPKGSGQKLFRLDDKTVCTVAGQYFLGGPPNERGETQGMALLSRQIAQITAQPDWKTLKSVEDKLNAVSHGLALTFGLILTMDNTLLSMSDPRTKLPVENIQLTVAGYDLHGLRVAQTVLKSTRDKGASFWTSTPLEVFTVEDSFRYVLAGIRNFDEPILNNPAVALDGISNSDLNAIKVYAQAKNKDGGRSLKLDELKGLGIALAKYSEHRAPNVIGAETQIAYLRDNRVDLFDVPESVTKNNAFTLPKEAEVHLSLISNVRVAAVGPMSLRLVENLARRFT
jgi:hypothetical protein